MDQALDFVLSKLNLGVGTREQGAQAPVAYEMPREVVAEAVVNAVAHRDYSSTGSVQVMLFADRLEVWDPGGLPSSLTLRGPHGSAPTNPLLAEPLYLARYIERMGTGTGDMIRCCREAGLPDPEFTLRDGFLVTLRRPTNPTAACRSAASPPWALSGCKASSLFVEAVERVKRMKQLQLLLVPHSSAHVVLTPPYS